MKILDLFCGVGGSAVGLKRAFPNAEITGVDLKNQPRYPFNFIQGNALEYPTDGFDFIWASPPCQHFTQMLNHGLTDRNKHKDLVSETRELLKDSKVPYIIENVVGAPVRKDLMLCGEMFGLRVIRHRVFECSFPVIQPKHITHRKEGSIRKKNDGGWYNRVYGHETGKKQWAESMGMNLKEEWIKGIPKYYELAQAIPPAYSEYIGSQFKET